MSSSSSRSEEGEEEEKPDLVGWITFFDELGRFLQYSGRAVTSANESFASYAVECLETCIISLALVAETLSEASSRGEGGANGTLASLVQMVRDVLDACRTMSTVYEQRLDTIAARSAGVGRIAYHPQLVPRSGRGRPCFSISKEQLLYLSSMSFSWTEISNMLGVSRMTIYRRRVAYGLTFEPDNVPTDVQLLTVLREIKLGHPELGEVLIMGRLRGMGYKVTRERLRQAIRSIDPLYTALR